jgi:hypothetical protein
MEGAAVPDGHVLGKKMNLDGIFFLTMNPDGIGWFCLLESWVQKHMTLPSLLTDEQLNVRYWAHLCHAVSGISKIE